MCVDYKKRDYMGREQRQTLLASQVRVVEESIACFDDAFFAIAGQVTRKVSVDSVSSTIIYNKHRNNIYKTIYNLYLHDIKNIGDILRSTFQEVIMSLLSVLCIVNDEKTTKTLCNYARDKGIGLDYMKLRMKAERCGFQNLVSVFSSYTNKNEQ